MSVILDKPVLWTYGEASKIFGMPFEDGTRTIRMLVKAHGLKPKKCGSGKTKGLTRADLEVLAKALNKRIDTPSDPAI